MLMGFDASQWNLNSFMVVYLDFTDWSRPPFSQSPPETVVDAGYETTMEWEHIPLMDLQKCRQIGNVY
jgi:hypothetical protein